MSRLKYGADESRPCKRCGYFLPADCFHVQKRNEDGSVYSRKTICKECQKQYQRELSGAKPRVRLSEAEAKRRRHERYLAMMADPERSDRHRKRRREEAQRRRDRAKVDAEAAKALQAVIKRHYVKVRSDPEAWQLRLMDQRIRYRGEHESSVLPMGANGGWKPGAHLETIVDADPFLDYLAEAFPDATSEELSELTGIPSRRFREFRLGKAVVSLDLVDRALTIGLGRPDLVAALYPLEVAV